MKKFILFLFLIVIFTGCVVDLEENKTKFEVKANNEVYVRGMSGVYIIDEIEISINYTLLYEDTNDRSTLKEVTVETKNGSSVVIPVFKEIIEGDNIFKFNLMDTDIGTDLKTNKNQNVKFNFLFELDNATQNNIQKEESFEILYKYKEEVVDIEIENELSYSVIQTEENIDIEYPKVSFLLKNYTKPIYLKEIHITESENINIITDVNELFLREEEKTLYLMEIVSNALIEKLKIQNFIRIEVKFVFKDEADNVFMEKKILFDYLYQSEIVEE